MPHHVERRLAAIVAADIADAVVRNLVVHTIPGFEDIAIAATAAARCFTVLTANERHFAPLGVPLANPLKRLPPAGA